MENKYLGMIILAAVGILFAMAMIPSIASNQAAMVNTVNQANETVTAAQFTDGAGYALKGHDATGLIVINNSNTLLSSGNYTVTSRVLQSTGNVRSVIKASATSEYNATAVKVSYSYSPDGYVDDSAARSVAGLIVLFTVIGLVVFALWGSNIRETVSAWGY